MLGLGKGGVMSVLISAKDMTIDYVHTRPLDGVTIGVHTRDCIGIVGVNGGGKSTLLKALAQQVELDAGTVTMRSSCQVGLLLQDDALDDQVSVERAVVGAQLPHEWASNPKIREVIGALIDPDIWTAQVGTLSGGQRRRVDLARLLVRDDDLLMLDEPTNHLDIEGISWLANHLKQRFSKGEGALLIISHDRWFLDEIATVMWEVHDGSVDAFEGGYAAYIQQREERARLAQVTEAKRQNLLRRELAWLSRGAQARSSKPKFHLKAARALIAADPPLRNERELKQFASARLGKQVIDFVDCQLSSPSKDILLQPFTWIIGPGDRIGLVGKNGAGKTTFLKAAQKLVKPSAGRIKIGQTVRIGVLSQRLEELAPFEDELVRDLLKRYKQVITIGKKSYTSATILEDLGFPPRGLKSYVRDLSGGQRRILQLTLMLFDEPNVLLLDEPGNDLDTDMLAALESFLDNWAGTLIVVSHDRYFLERVTDNQYALIDQRLVHLPGGVDEYLKLEALKESSSASVESSGFIDCKEGQPQGFSDAAIPALSNKDRRAYKKEYDAAERKLESLDGELNAASQALNETDPTDYLALHEAQERIDAIKHQIHELELRWLELGELLEL